MEKPKNVRNIQKSWTKWSQNVVMLGNEWKRLKILETSENIRESENVTDVQNCQKMLVIIWKGQKMLEKSKNVQKWKQHWKIICPPESSPALMGVLSTGSKALAHRLYLHFGYISYKCCKNHPVYSIRCI